MESNLPLNWRIRSVRGERIRIYSFFCSSKVIAKWKNSLVISSGYTRYENCQSSCRVVSFAPNTGSGPIPRTERLQTRPPQSSASQHTQGLMHPESLFKPSQLGSWKLEVTGDDLLNL